MKEQTDLSIGEKHKAVDQLNELQGKAQQIYFELEQFTGHDPGDASLTKTIELIDEIGKIRNRILKGDNEKDKITANEKSEV